MIKLLLAFIVAVFVVAVPSVSAASRVKVAVIDSGLDLQDLRFKASLCPDGHEDFTGSGTVRDDIGHGTWIVGAIQAIMGDEGKGKYCILILKAFDNNAQDMSTLRPTAQAMRHAATAGAMFINYSGGGPTRVPAEFELIKSLSPVITLFFAAGNNSANIDTPSGAFYPASYRSPNAIVVGALDSDLVSRAKCSNYSSKPDMIYMPGTDLLSTLPRSQKPPKRSRTGYMTGTSMATGVATAMTLRAYLGLSTLVISDIPKVLKNYWSHR